MIKIDQGNYTKPLSENPIIIDRYYLDNQLQLTWDCNNNYISFTMINSFIEKLHKRKDVDCLIIVLSVFSFNNLLTDMNHLRKYDNLAQLPFSNEIEFKSSYVPVIITKDEKLTDNGYILEVINKNILNTKTTITINEEIEITSYIDKSKEQLKIVGLHKFCNIKPL